MTKFLCAFRNTFNVSRKFFDVYEYDGNVLQTTSVYASVYIVYAFEKFNSNSLPEGTIFHFDQPINRPNTAWTQQQSSKAMFT